MPGPQGLAGVRGTLGLTGMRGERGNMGPQGQSVSCSCIVFALIYKCKHCTFHFVL